MVSIRELLKKRDESAYRMSIEIGVSDDTIRALRNDEPRRCKANTAKKICEYFNLNIEDVKEFQNLYDASLSAAKAAKTRKARVAKKTVPKKKEVKGDSCRNHACPLNKLGVCINDVVNSGRAKCANKDVPKDKPHGDSPRKRSQVNINLRAYAAYKKRGAAMI